MIAVLAVIVIIINSIINIKKRSNKKYLPMFVFLVLGGISLFLQIKCPELFLVSLLEVLVTIVMYFTIENPDLKLLAEVQKARNLSEQTSNEKSNFLNVVTMDITMPVMDGIEAVREIIEIDPGAKVIMVTAAGQKTNMVEALKRGAADFIQKPFDSAVIINTIEKVLEDE